MENEKCGVMSEERVVRSQEWRVKSEVRREELGKRSMAWEVTREA